MSSSDTLGDAAGSAMLNPGNVNLTDAVGNADLTRQITCILQAGSNDYNGQLGKQHERLSALNCNFSHWPRSACVLTSLQARGYLRCSSS